MKKLYLLLVLLALLLVAITRGQTNCGKFISITATNDTNGVLWGTVRYYTEPAETNTVMIQVGYPDDSYWYNWQPAPSHPSGRLTNLFTRAGVDSYDVLYRMVTNVNDHEWHFPSFSTYSTNSGSLDTNLPPFPGGDSLLSQEILIEHGRSSGEVPAFLYPPTRLTPLR